MQHTTRVAHHHHDKATGLGIPMWALAVGTTVFGAAALYVLVQDPAALPFAAVIGLFAVVARLGYGRLRAATQEKAEASGAVANTGLVIAAIALAPLIAFALLWTALILIIGAAWLLHLVGLA
jgi:hypothetical protein